MKNGRLFLLNTVLLATCLGCFWGRSIEDAKLSNADFLTSINLNFRGWKTRDVPLTKKELSLLVPDAVLVRQYAGPSSQWAELAVIAGHRKQTVHSPGFCMVGGGWELTSQKDYDLKLAGRTIPTVRSYMVKDGKEILITYFFTDGDYSTRSLLQFQGVQLFKRFKSRIPIGALVRVTVPVSRDRIAAEAFTREFAEAMLPRVLGRLQATSLSVQ